MKPSEYGEQLVKDLMRTFACAYRDHARGLSEDAILITHDIFAAVWEGDPRTPKAHRQAIRSACNAYDSGVPLDVAQKYMRMQFKLTIERLRGELDNN